MIKFMSKAQEMIFMQWVESQPELRVLALPEEYFCPQVTLAVAVSPGSLLALSEAVAGRFARRRPSI